LLYFLLREIAGVALRWYYSEVTIRGRERVPAEGALLVVGNHPNALVDALLIGWAVPRRLRITAKATIFGGPASASFLRAAGVIPLRRVSDEGRTREEGAASHPPADRNAEAFAEVNAVLRGSGAVLIFPEGKSHDDPSIAPLKTGPARMALQAAAQPDVSGVSILPVGLVFERKDAPRTRVLVEIGDPFLVVPSMGVTELTGAIDRRLRAVTLNYPSWQEAEETRTLAALFASIIEDSPSISAGRGIAAEVDVARRVSDARRRLAAAPPELAARVNQFMGRLAAFSDTLRESRIDPADVGIPTTISPGARFALRETALLALLGPVALWGRINHWLPFRAATALARWNMTAQDQPAMRTVVAGLSFVLVAYAVQTAVVWKLATPLIAAFYLATLPVSADVDLRLRDRIGRARHRMRAYLTLRRNRPLAQRLKEERRDLAAELLALDDAVMREEIDDQGEPARGGR
jgi:glycerol-3-phosphate O-acyltransferase / dihydroxyacetone phosphate acyltransferase